MTLSEESSKGEVGTGEGFGGIVESNLVLSVMEGVEVVASCVCSGREVVGGGVVAWTAEVPGVT